MAASMAFTSVSYFFFSSQLQGKQEWLGQSKGAWIGRSFDHPLAKDPNFVLNFCF